MRKGLSIVKKILVFVGLGILSILVLVILRQLFDINIWETIDQAPSFKYFYRNIAMYERFTYREAWSDMPHYIALLDSQLRNAIFLEMFFFILPTLIYITFTIIKNRHSIKAKLTYLKYNSKSARIKRLEEEITQLKQEKS